LACSRPSTWELEVCEFFINEQQRLFSVTRFFLEFLAKLSNCMDRWDADKTVLSSLFLGSEAYFQDYAPYVNSFTEISRLVHKLMEQKSDFRAWIMEQRKLPRVADKYLIDFLIMPVQRIPRYSLLLRELVKATPAEHPDYLGKKKKKKEERRKKKEERRKKKEERRKKKEERRNKKEERRKKKEERRKKKEER